MSRAKLVDYYIDKSKEPDFQINQIRKELEAKNIPDEEIKAIVRLVDNYIQMNHITKSSNKRANEFIIGGIFLALFGAVITIGTYTGLINTGNSFVIMYGPFFVGLSFIFGGLAMKRKVDWFDMKEWK